MTLFEIWITKYNQADKDKYWLNERNTGIEFKNPDFGFQPCY